MQFHQNSNTLNSTSSHSLTVEVIGMSKINNTLKAHTGEQGNTLPLLVGVQTLITAMKINRVFLS